MRILNGGTEAITRVLIECRDGEGNRWWTVGVSANIIDASFQALIDAVIYKLVKAPTDRCEPLPNSSHPAERLRRGGLQLRLMPPAAAALQHREDLLGALRDQASRLPGRSG